ncbi:uncharacterized protein LOC129570191 isoform X1 [Sitodiplosis mosellana]|uniref:uncharacterized protein LOC129570191 isoform X1 n=1 Tax=Sitodiplosis mosellana TaxID=263140 RepID=UPI0024452618|nr:uncharacterized protein LOC129570191 isoform X1 [Sitodiplosis mosellana]
MGSNSSKTFTQSAQQTPVSKVKNCSKGKNNLENILLDPRSPDVNRTPLASILVSRMKTAEETPSTPTKYVRETLLNDSKEKKFLDPRSPSQFIPRTPLNLSLNGENIENSSGQYSLEYSGCIEEASCRNFNERLANITFDDDDLYAEGNAPKTVERKTNEFIDDISTLCTVDEENDHDHDQPSSDSLELTEKGIQNTPVTTLEAPKDRFDTNVVYADGENVSPLVDPNMCIKRNALSAFSSTPISTAISQQKLAIKKNNKPNTEIFKDDQKINNIEYATPAKRMAKIKEVDNPRTPFGSIQNHRSKSTENLSQQPQTQLKESVRPYHINDENFTPNSKLQASSKQGNKSRRINQIAYD